MLKDCEAVLDMELDVLQRYTRSSEGADAQQVGLPFLQCVCACVCVCFHVQLALAIHATASTKARQLDHKVPR
jgi:hypothetical protein